MPAILKWSGLCSLIAVNIGFSFYYSTQMVKQNQLLNDHQNTYNSLFQNNLDLQYQLAQLRSIQKLDQYAQRLNLIPIEKSLKIRPPSP